jgi:integrase
LGLGKQAKTLSKGQIDAMLAYLSTTRHPARNRLIFLLSAKAGLRAKEIAKLTWRMTNDSQGEIGWTICLLDSGSKGKSGGMIPLGNEVRDALIEYRNEVVGFAGPFYRAAIVDFSASDRKHVPALVPTPRLYRLLQPQRTEDFHHQCCPEDLDGRGDH